MVEKWEKKKIEKAIDKLNMPKKYRDRIVNLDNFLSHDITMQLSIRQDAGKTSASLILSIVLRYCYNVSTIYCRCDNKQITAGVVKSLYNVIRANNYISILFDNVWNDVKYEPMYHRFYLVKTELSDTGETIIVRQDEKPLCYVVSLEKYIDYKSGFNDVKADYMILDEFMDSSRSTHNQMIELQNNISTFLRYEDEENRPNGRLLMLGNNQNPYSHWFEEFCIEDIIQTLTYGGYIENNTEMGTTFCCELLYQSDEHKERIKKKKIRFAGFPTEKMNVFTGLSEWQGNNYQHIESNLWLTKGLCFNNFYIHHRNRYLKIHLYSNDFNGDFAYITYSKQPIYNDNIILAEFPKLYELWGYGEQAKNEVIKNYCKCFFELYKSNRVYFRTNSEGQLFDDYIKSIRVNKIKR